MKRFILFVTVLCLYLVPVMAFGAQERKSDGRLVVATSFHAVNELVLAVAGEKVQVVPVVPETADTHHYELRRKDIQLLNEANVVFAIGLELEEWLEDLIEDGLVSSNKVIFLSENLSLIEIDEDKTGDKPHSHENHSHGEHSHDSDYDPHVWLSLSECITMVNSITKTLSTVDAKNATYYEQNAKSFIAELSSLQAEYKQRLAPYAGKSVVVAHEAFAYLCRDFNLKQRAVSGVFNDGEPSAKSLASLVDFCKANGVKVIFTEEAANENIAKTLARDANAKIEKLYTMEGKEENLSLLQRHKANLERILKSF